MINQTVFRRGAPRAPQDLTEWVYLDGVHETLVALAARGYLLLVCTNQPDVARGWQTRDQVDMFHRLLEQELPIARIYACFHDNDAACECRKPKPGMLVQGAADFDIDLARSFMIGDRADRHRRRPRGRLPHRPPEATRATEPGGSAGSRNRRAA